MWAALLRGRAKAQRRQEVWGVSLAEQLVIRPAERVQHGAGVLGLSGVAELDGALVHGGEEGEGLGGVAWVASPEQELREVDLRDTDVSGLAQGDVGRQLLFAADGRREAGISA